MTETEFVKKYGVVRFVLSWAMLEDLRHPCAVVVEQINRAFSVFDEVTHVEIRQWGDKPATIFEIYGTGRPAAGTGISYEVRCD